MAPSWPVSRRPAATSLDRVRGRRRHGPALAKRVKILASQKRIVYKPANCFYQVLSAGVYSKHGTNISGVVFDEFHTQPNRARFDMMAKGSGDARTQPLYFLITTAGTDTHSVCYEQPQLALDILAGRKHDPRFYPVIYGANVNDDWTAEATWRKANPSLDITVPVAKVVETCASARQNLAGEYTFRQLRLNQWIKQEVRWMPMRIWNANNAPVAPTALEDQVCYVELDLSSTSDITAFVLVFPPERSDEPYQILPHLWLPEDTLTQRVARDRVSYDLWATHKASSPPKATSSTTKRSSTPSSSSACATTFAKSPTPGGVQSR